MKKRLDFYRVRGKYGAYEAPSERRIVEILEEISKTLKFKRIV